MPLMEYRVAPISNQIAVLLLGDFMVVQECTLLSWCRLIRCGIQNEPERYCYSDGHS